MRLSTAFFKTISVSLTLAALFACSGGNNDAASNMIDAAGKHVVSTGYTSWRQQHWVVYEQLTGGSSDTSPNTLCSQCHGADLNGGISKVSCFSASFQGASCHANPDFTLGHPSSWADPTASDFHGASTFGFPAKPVQGSTTLADDCGLCHAVATNTALIGSAPSCITTSAQFGIACHSFSPAAAPKGCTSCHHTPPSGAAGALGANGAALPDVAGDHAPHISAFGLGCKACHNGGGSHTVHHAVGNGVAFLNLSGGYKAKVGTFGFTNGKCSAVSCHGGQQTPNWFTGGIDVNTQCLSCHEQGSATVAPLPAVGLVVQMPQYNSFFSGFKKDGVSNLHQFHLVTTNPQDQVTFANIFCTDCHSRQKLALQHFTKLSTHNFDGGDPVDTIGGPDTLISDGSTAPSDISGVVHSSSYLTNPSRISCSIVNCHGPGQTMKWINP